VGVIVVRRKGLILAALLIASPWMLPSQSASAGETRLKGQPRPIVMLGTMVLSRAEGSGPQKLLREMSKVFNFSDYIPRDDVQNDVVEDHIIDRIETASEPIVVASADPLFPKWQERASQRIEMEERRNDPAPHDLADKHPDALIVVCEAGCRGKVEEIVYTVQKTAVVQATMITTDGAAKGVPATSEPDGGVIECLAGCYSSAKQHKARTAERTKPASGGALVVTASLKQAAKKFAARAVRRQPVFAHVRFEQTGMNGAIVTRVLSANGQKHAAIARQIKSASVIKSNMRHAHRLTRVAAKKAAATSSRRLAVGFKFSAQPVRRFAAAHARRRGAA
jgi:hypothetical protein